MRNWFFFLVTGVLLYGGHDCLAQNEIGIGETVTDTVYAWKKCNKTNIKLVKGGTYKITATGQWQDAGFEPTDANGFEGFTKAMKKGAFLKPMKKENYMMLLAKVGGKKIPVGTESIISIKKSGRLIFIPNDATFFFGNNSGELVVRVERLE